MVIAVGFFNESGHINHLLSRFEEASFDFPHKIIFVNDASADGSDQAVAQFIERQRAHEAGMISLERNLGIGNAIRLVIHYGLQHRFDVCCVIAGNGKDDPREIPKVVRAVIDEGYDYVQGSRFLQGGSHSHLPLQRDFMIRTYTGFANLVTGFSGTDATNGFRAYRLSLFCDKRINLDQPWLNRYELETYLHYKAITLGYSVKEVAVSKDYLPGVRNYSKMKPVLDWWKLARPMVLLKLGLKH